MLYINKQVNFHVTKTKRLQHNNYSHFTNISGFNLSINLYSYGNNNQIL
jgi:hypothetical protein